MWAFFMPWLIHSFTHLIDILLEVFNAEVVNDVPRADQQGNSVAAKQFKVVVVGLIAQKTLDGIWNIKNANDYYFFAARFFFFYWMEGGSLRLLYRVYARQLTDRDLNAPLFSRRRNIPMAAKNAFAKKYEKIHF